MAENSWTMYSLEEYVIINLGKDLSVQLTEELKKKLREKKSFTLLVMGKTGAGKSSLLNYVLGADLFEMGKSKANPCTSEVSMKSVVKNGVTIIAWDSPGLQDGTENEDKYLADMKAKCSEVDLTVYCISMKETRSDLKNHDAAIHKITECLGQTIWKNALFVLTYANMAADGLDERGDELNIEQEFCKRVKEWKDCIQEALQKCGVDQSIVDNIQVVPAGHCSELQIPGCDDWISNVWGQFLELANESGKIAMLKREYSPDGGFVDQSTPPQSPRDRKIAFTPKIKKILKEFFYLF